MPVYLVCDLKVELIPLKMEEVWKKRMEQKY